MHHPAQETLPTTVFPTESPVHVSGDVYLTFSGMSRVH